MEDKDMFDFLRKKKLVEFPANVPSARRERISFESEDGPVSFLAGKTTRKKISFWAKDE